MEGVHHVIGVGVKVKVDEDESNPQLKLWIRPSIPSFCHHGWNKAFKIQG